MEPKSKYLIIMDLEDAEHDLRDAEREYREVEKEKKTLEKWGFGREIPSELLGELTSQRKEVRGLTLTVKKMNEKLVTAHAQISTKFLKEEIVKGVDVRDAYDDPVNKPKRWQSSWIDGKEQVVKRRSNKSSRDMDMRDADDG